MDQLVAFLSQPYLLPLYFSMIGVLIGGALTFSYQLLFRYFDRRRARGQRLHRLQRFTAALFNEVLLLHKHVASQVPSNTNAPKWMFIQPLVGHSTVPREYDLDDLGLLGGEKFNLLSNKLPLLALERNATVAALAVYGDVRRQLMESLKPYTVFGANNTITFNPTFRQDATAVRLEAEAKSLAESLYADLNASRGNVYELAPAFNEMLAHYIKKKPIPRIDLPVR